jgi:hypothetical protein
MTVEKVKDIYRFHRLVFDKEDNSFVSFARLKLTKLLSLLSKTIARLILTKLLSPLSKAIARLKLDFL